MTNYQKLYHSNQETFIAYRQFLPKKTNKQGLIFLGGFNSNMDGTKAEAIAKYAEKQDYDFIRFDYSGHGQSSGNFVDGSIDAWLKDTLHVIDELADKPQILIGSSMGGWLMLLAALFRPDKISGLIGLAAAPDFTEELIWNALSEEQKEELTKNKQILYKNEFCEDAYPISEKLITESRLHLLLNKKIPLNLPIHLIHGMNDKDVPFLTAIKIAEKVQSQNVKISLLKDSGHRLSSLKELEFILSSIEEFMWKNQDDYSQHNS